MRDIPKPNRFNGFHIGGLDVERSKPLKRLMPSVYEDTGLAGVNESSGSFDARRNVAALDRNRIWPVANSAF